MFDEDGVKIGSRYIVAYEGYLFFGDKEEGINRHDYDRWEDVQQLIWAYPDIITVYDNYYDVTWEKGEWY